MTDDIYEVLTIHTDLLRSCREIRLHLSTLTDYDIENIYFEKPQLRLLTNVDTETGEPYPGEQKRVAATIIHIQRHFGALVVMVNQLFPEAHVDQVSGRLAKQGVYADGILTKDVQLSEASVILKGLRDRDYTALQILALHDSLVMRTYFNNKENN